MVNAGAHYATVRPPASKAARWTAASIPRARPGRTVTPLRPIKWPGPPWVPYGSPWPPGYVEVDGQWTYHRELDPRVDFPARIADASTGAPPTRGSAHGVAADLSDEQMGIAIQS